MRRKRRRKKEVEEEEEEEKKKKKKNPYRLPDTAPKEYSDQLPGYDLAHFGSKAIYIVLSRQLSI